MNTEKMSLDQIRREGLKALERHLGPDGLIRFLQQFETGWGDYTKERHKWLKETRVDTLAEEIVKQRGHIDG
jgi:hypothetical protein